MSWLYSEYSVAEGYLRMGDHTPLNYSACLSELMLGAKEKLNGRDRLFTKLVVEAPKVTAEAMGIVKSYCCDEVGDVTAYCKYFMHIQYYIYFFGSWSYEHAYSFIISWMDKS